MLRHAHPFHQHLDFLLKSISGSVMEMRKAEENQVSGFSACERSRKGCGQSKKRGGETQFKIQLIPLVDMCPSALFSFADVLLRS